MTVREWFRVMRGVEVERQFLANFGWTVFDTMKVVERETRDHYAPLGTLTWSMMRRFADPIEWVYKDVEPLGPFGPYFRLTKRPAPWMSK